jgi:xylulokinase
LGEFYCCCSLARSLRGKVDVLTNIWSSTRNGTVQGAEDGEEKAPVLMWIAALDELLEKLSVDDFPFERVRAISGAGQVSCHAPSLSSEVQNRTLIVGLGQQQHSPVFWAHGADAILRDLDASFDLRSQLKTAFSSPTSPQVQARLQSDSLAHAFFFYSTWQDMTATPEALALEDLVGGPSALSDLTGGRGTSRSTASQILKLRNSDPTLLSATSRISLVSSFLCSILTGKLQGIDASDAAGTRLYNVEARKWDDKLCEEAGGEGIGLKKLMGEVELDGGKSLGTVSEWVSFGGSSQVRTS